MPLHSTTCARQDDTDRVPVTTGIATATTPAVRGPLGAAGLCSASSFSSRSSFSSSSAVSRSAAVARPVANPSTAQVGPTTSLVASQLVTTRISSTRRPHHNTVNNRATQATMVTTTTTTRPLEVLQLATLVVKGTMSRCRRRRTCTTTQAMRHRLAHRQERRITSQSCSDPPSRLNRSSEHGTTFDNQ